MLYLRKKYTQSEQGRQMFINQTNVNIINSINSIILIQYNSHNTEYVKQTFFRIWISAVMYK